MDAQFEDRLRGHLGKLLTNTSVSIADFQQWFMTAWWDAEEGAPDALYELGSRIEHLLFIWSSGEWSDATFLNALAKETAAFRAAGNRAVVFHQAFPARVTRQYRTRVRLQRLPVKRAPVSTPAKAVVFSPVH